MKQLTFFSNAKSRFTVCKRINFFRTINDSIKANGSMRETEVKNKSPKIILDDVNFLKNKNHDIYTVCFDTGADTSLFDINFINSLNPSQYNWGSNHSCINRDAQGNRIPTCDRMISIKLYIKLIDNSV